MAAELCSLREHIKMDSQIAQYCRLLDILLQKGALEVICIRSEEIVKCLWKSLLSWVHLQLASDSVSCLMISLVKKYQTLIGTEDDLVDALSEVLSRTTASHGQSTYMLVNFLITDFNFNEHMYFSGAVDREIGLKSWRYRCQLAEWLVGHLSPDCNVGELLYCLCLLNPKAASKQHTPSILKTGVERDLELFGLVKRFSLPYVTLSTAPVEIIDEMVLYVHRLISRFWSSFVLSNEIRISIYCSYATFLSMQGNRNEGDFRDLVEKMDRCMCHIVSQGEPGLLSQIHLVGVSYSLISSNLYQQLASRLKDCPEFALLLLENPDFQLSADVIRPVMCAIGEHIRNTNSVALKSVAGRLLLRFAEQVDTVPDLLLLYHECGNIIDGNARRELTSNIAKLIEEDIFANEYDEREAGIYRRLLMTYTLEANEKGDSIPCDLGIVTTSNIIRYVDVLPSLTDWQTVSSLLQRSSSNLVFTLRLTGELLCDPTRYYLHHKLLEAVLQNDGVLQAAEEVIPNFACMLDCHYNTVVLYAKRSQDRLPYINVPTPLRNDDLVENLRRNNLENLGSSAFPAAMFLYVNESERYRNALINTFWSVFRRSPYSVLSSLWKAALFSIPCNSYRLLLHNMLSIAGSLHRKALDNKQKEGFQLVFHSAISVIIHAVAKSSLPLASEIISEIAPSAKATCIDINIIKGVCEDVLGHTEIRMEGDAKQFLQNGNVMDIRTFQYCSFWKHLLVLIRKEYRTFSLSKSQMKDEIVSRLLFAWDVLPHFRRYIAPILSMFDYTTAVSYHTMEFQNVLRLIRDYCILELSNPRLQSIDIFNSCLHILSCKNFGYLSVGDSSKNFISKDLVEDSGVLRWPSTLFIDFLETVNFGELDITVFVYISECSNFVPKLCQIVVPFMLALDCSDGMSAANALLQYATLVIRSDTEGLESARRRMGRCLAECIDGIGLYRLSRVALDSDVYVDGMCSLIECCMLAGLPHHANAVANLLYDRLMAINDSRPMAAFSGVSTKNTKFIRLLKDIYLALGSTAALKTLPTEVQNEDRVRVLLAMARMDWLDVMSNPCASYEELLKAYWYCGFDYHGPCKKMKYGLAIRNALWTEVSYPKKFRSHEERLFSSLYVRYRGATTFLKFLDFFEDVECESAVYDEYPNSLSISNIRDLEILRQCGELQKNDIVSLPDNQLVLLTALVMRSQHDSRNLSNKNDKLIISTLLKRLCSQKAFQPCFTILDTYSGSSCALEKCRVLTIKGDVNTAECRLRVLLESSELSSCSSSEHAFVVEARCLLAELLADHKNMLEEAICILRQGLEGFDKLSPNCESRLRILLLLHRLSARQLSEVEEHLESRAFRMKEDAIREWTRQSCAVAKRPPTHATRRIECELRCEKEAVEFVKKKLVASAVNTVVAGLEALELLSQPYTKQPSQVLEQNYEILRLIFPLIDVIFRFDRNKDVVKAFRRYIANGMVPAVWVQVIGHLMSHCFARSPIAPVIRTMVVKLVLAYPFHVLHTVLMYKFNENCSHVVDSLLEEAERRATDQIAKSRLHEIIEDMTAAHIAYLQFVAVKITDTRFFKKRIMADNKAVYELLNGLSIVSMSEVLRRVPLPIIEQKLGIAGDYSGQGIIMWDSIERTCVQADGLSAPKILRMKGSDEKFHKIIWKNDDVRQDCLVEQLFSVVNGILNHGDSSKFLRTYKVVPLDSKSGLIEFCEGTVSLKELLCGSDLVGGLHVKEEPNDKTPLDARTMLKDIAKANEASTLFRTACERFRPVFRYFFYEQHSTVQLWTEMINNYRRSLAQWCIVTYVVGLGDRHLSNVLFEKDTCKLVHIDLGMILEYSKRTLPIPERVPFRLTRDLLDPILIEGTGGRLAELAVQTMRLLRENKHVILGLASVLLRETISNFEEVESSSEGRPSFVSETAIARLRDKLSGTDDTFGVQDVEHQHTVTDPEPKAMRHIAANCADSRQPCGKWMSAVGPYPGKERVLYNRVRRLFAEATNVDNLSRMFVGWMPFV